MKKHGVVFWASLTAVVSVAAYLYTSITGAYVRPVATRGEILGLIDLAKKTPKEKFIRNEDVYGVWQIEFGCTRNNQKAVYLLNYGKGISGLWIHYHPFSPYIYGGDFIDRNLDGRLDAARDETPIHLKNRGFVFKEGAFGILAASGRIEDRRYWQTVYAEALRCLRENIEKA